MKKIFKIFAVVSVFAGLVSCVKYADYKTEPFASVDVASAKITEPAVGESAIAYKLPVHVYNATSDCSVSYEVKDVNAKQGVDYTVIGGTGVLNFAKGVETQELEFSISGQPGTFTGDVSFQVVLKEATNNVALGAISTAKITIADKDHPLAAILGTWNVSHGGSGYSPDTFTTTFEPVDGDVHKIWITNLDDDSCSGSFIGVVSDDFSTITVPIGQLSTGMYSGKYNVVLWGLDDGGNFLDESDLEAVTFTLEDGKYVSDFGFGIMAADASLEVLGYLNYMFGPVTFSK